MGLSSRRLPQRVRGEYVAGVPVRAVTSHTGYRLNDTDIVIKSRTQTCHLPSVMDRFDPRPPRVLGDDNWTSVSSSACSRHVARAASNRQSATKRSVGYCPVCCARSQRVVRSPRSPAAPPEPASRRTDATCLPPPIGRPCRETPGTAGRRARACVQVLTRLTTLSCVRSSTKVRPAAHETTVARVAG